MQTPGYQTLALSEELGTPSGDPGRAHHSSRGRNDGLWSGTAVRYLRTLYTQAHLAFANSTHGLS